MLGTTASFIYDGDGNRVKKIENGEITIYINRYYEKNLTSGNVTTSYYLGGRLIATRENEVLRYVHQDHLTGTSLMTDASGAQIGETMKYLPFGETISGTVPTDIKFTSQRLDETGLYYFNARYYDVTIGRFISADTLVSSLNPQCFNRYSYCLNNPLKYIDPSGYESRDEGMEDTPKRVMIDGVDITDFTLKQLWEFYRHSSPEVQELIRAWMAFRNQNPAMAQELLDSETIVNIKWGTLDEHLASLVSVDDEGNIQITMNSYYIGSDSYFTFGTLSCEATIAHDLIYGPGIFGRILLAIFGAGQIFVGFLMIWNTGIVGAYPGATLINAGWNTIMDAGGWDHLKIPFQLGPYNSAIPIRPIR